MAKFYVLGLGVDAVHHATVEALQAMSSCARLFVCGTSREQEKFLSGFCPKGALVPASKGGDDKALEAGILKALASGKDVGLATPGHPFYWSALAGRIIEKAKKQGFEWQTFGSISPMGLAISAAGITLGTDIFGLQSFDGAALAQKEAVLNPEWPLIVYFYQSLSMGVYERAAARLSSFYGASHPVTWCFSGQSKDAAVKDLRAAFSQVSSSTVFYLPAKTAPASKVGCGDSLGRVPKGVKVPAWVKE
jgi:hypothetical protein